MAGRKVRRPALPRRPWYGPDKLRAAFLAGQGKSAGEIASIIGGTTGPRVRSMLRVHNIPLLREKGGEDILFVKWKRSDREALEKAALAMDRDGSELAALIVRKVLETPQMAREMIDDLDVVGV